MDGVIAEYDIGNFDYDSIRPLKSTIKKIEDLMGSRETRKRVGMAGRNSIKKYTSEVVSEQWYNLIEKK